LNPFSVVFKPCKFKYELRVVPKKIGLARKKLVGFDCPKLYVIQGIIKNLRKWEDEGWMRIQNEDIFEKIAYELDTKGGNILPMD